MRSGSTTSQSSAAQKIDITPFHSLYRAENIFLHGLFRKHGYELRICGGAVRDVLLGITPKDVDLATDATPTQMIEMFSKENIRMLNRNGEIHGTITARINDQINFEVTTLRIDVEPDGRHTKVIFTKDWKLDAERRDLTVNSMFLSLDLPTSDCTSPPSSDDAPAFTDIHVQPPVYGYLFDYFNGREDLTNRRIRFVGDPSVRIREDFLRILRYFRFHGRLARENEHDELALKAIAEHAAGLSRIAGERCWMELKSILTCPSAPLLLRRMHDLGVFPYIGFPSNPDFDELDRVWKRNVAERDPNPVTCLSALLTTFEDVETLNNRLKLSNQEIMTILFLVKHRSEYLSLENDVVLEHYKRELLLSPVPVNKLRPILHEMMLYTGLDCSLVNQFAEWEPPKFPVNGLELCEKWDVQRRELQRNLFALKRQWVDSGFTMDCDQLLSEKNRETLTIPDEIPTNLELFMKRKRRTR